MYVHYTFDVGPERRAHRRAEGYVRHEMSVHDVHVYPVRALPLDRRALRSEIGEIGGEDRRRDLDGAVKCISHQGLGV